MSEESRRYAHDPAQFADNTTMAARLSGVRRFTDDLLAWMRGRGSVLIIMHDNPDPDCLASAMALRQLFLTKLDREPVIAFSGIIGRSENLVMAKELGMSLTPLEIVDLADFQTICMVDTQPGTGNNSLPADASVDLVIDHHPLRESTKTCRWIDVRDDYGVTATILYEYLLAQEVSISAKLATAIFYAIKSDTQDLGREANRPDREAYLRLFPLTSKRLLYLITNPRQPIEYFRTIRRTLDNAKIYGNVIVVNMEEVMFPELIAEMADFMLKLETIEAVLCMGVYGDDLVLSLRTARQNVNCGEIIKKIVAGYGLAGGHALMAGGKVDRVAADDSARQALERIIVERFLAEMGCSAEDERRIET
jgi:nanoRNase/pAp phosphatase (c-di-AMP/oligoRNAs hydrolase)